MAASDHPEDQTNDSLPDDAIELAEEQAEDQQAEGEENESEAEEKLNLEVKVEERGACERHITVTVARDDIDRYFNKEYTEMMPTAQVPGFRPGRAPRRLIEQRFRKDIAEKVKGALVMASISQVNEQEDLAAISEPEFDFEAIEVPEEGPMTFEFDLEVRPQFDVPQWKGLRIEKPVQEFTEKDIDAAIERLLSEHGQLVPKDGPAELGDYVSTDLTFAYQGNVLSSAQEEVIRLRPVLSFRDGRISNFGEIMVGVTAGETREAEAEIGEDAPNMALRGQRVQGTFKVHEVKRLQLPEMTPELLAELGDFESEAEFRDAVRDMLKRRLEYEQHRRVRQQITAALTAAANWDLPPGLLERQSRRELSRAVMELQRSGFSDAEIRAYENDLRQNSRRETARALKEHFILERIAELENIEESPEDYDEEIRLIARQSGETPRRVRARLEKQGGMDVLRNQIIERKVIDLIQQHAQFAEIPYAPEQPVAEALDRAVASEEPASEIPEAKPEVGSGEPTYPHQSEDR